MTEYEAGAIYLDSKGELYMRVYDPFGKFPWVFLNCLASLEPAEPRSEGFPHQPLVRLVPEK